MATIPINIELAGQTVAVSSVNNSFNNIQVGTANLNDDNTRTEWCSRYHVINPPAANVFNRDFAMVEDSDTTQVVNWNTFQQVNLAPAFRIQYFNLTVEPGQVLRAHFDINVTAAEFDYGEDWPTDDRQDCYQFRFYYRDANSGVVSPIGPTSTYSVSDIWNYTTTGTPPDDPPGSIGGWGIVDRIGQRCNVNLCKINTGVGNLVIDWIECRVRIVNLALLNSISIKEGDFTAFTARH